MLKETANTLLCKVGKLPFPYLGLPIGGNYSRLEIWDRIIKRVSKKLAMLKGKMLSIGGRLTLIKASITSLPLYFMSIFPIPKGIVEKIYKLQLQFLWGGRPKKSALSPAPLMLI